MNHRIERLLQAARKHGASDLHLTLGVAPAVRLDGEMRLLGGEPFTEDDLRAIADELMDDKQRIRFQENWETCFSLRLDSVGRFRVAVYLHTGVPEFVIRLCATEIHSGQQLGLPVALEDVVRLSSGLVLIAGPTGMGKTTTLTYMIDLINQSRRAKIITIEDPVEFEHRSNRSIVVQQEVHGDVRSYAAALRHALRQDPDVIVVGEMRDLETMSTALIAAETGHLVLGTLHTPDSVQTLQRIYSVFPAEQQNAVTIQLANSLQAVIAQKLLPRAVGEGRVLATEVCIATPAVRTHIRERQVHQLYSEMQTGRKYKMHTMDQRLLELYQTGEITYDIALANARDAGFIAHRSEGDPSRPLEVGVRGKKY